MVNLTSSLKKSPPIVANVANNVAPIAGSDGGDAAPPPEVAAQIARAADTAPVDAGAVNRMGPPVPPEVAASIAQLQAAPPVPPEVNAVVGENTTAGDTNPLSKLAASPGIGADQRPQLAKPHVGFLDRLKQALPYVGAAGAAMEAAGGGPHADMSGANLLQQSLANQRAAALKREELEQVEKPKAQAMADYYSGKNESAQKVAETNAASRTNVANINANSREQIAALQNGEIGRAHV